MFRGQLLVVWLMGILVALGKGVFSQVQQEQYLSWWTTPGCTGNPSRTATTDWTFYDVPTATTIFIRPNGLFGIQFCTSGEESSCSNPVVSYGYSGTDCLAQNIPFGARFIRIRRFGDQLQVEKALYLFPEAGFQGSHRKVLEGGWQNLQDFSARSYYFAGANSWYLKTADEYICLNYTDPVVGVNGYGFTYQTTTPFSRILDSAKFGCDTQTTSTTTTVNPNVGSGYANVYQHCSLMMILVIVLFASLMS